MSPRFQTNHRRPCRAFTLIELLVVIGIIGVMMALVLPAFRGFGRSAAMNSAVAQVRSAISLARQYAINKQTTAYVIFVNSNTVASSSVASERWRAYRSYAVFVWASASGGYYVKEWTALPDGVVFTPDTSAFPATSGSADRGHGDNVINGYFTRDFVFPDTSSKTTNSALCIDVAPDGTMTAWIGSTAEIYLTEGAVDTNGVLSLLNKTNSLKFGIEIQGLTGQTRVRDYNK